MFCKYFLPFGNLHFLDSVMSSEAQMFLISIKSNASMFSFVACAFGLYIRNRYNAQKSWRFTFMLSSNNFTVFSLKFSSMIHLVFVNGMKQEIQFHYFACRYPVASAPLVEKTLNCPGTLVKNSLTINVRDYLWTLFHC